MLCQTSLPVMCVVLLCQAEPMFCSPYSLFILSHVASFTRKFTSCISSQRVASPNTSSFYFLTSFPLIFCLFLYTPPNLQVLTSRMWAFPSFSPTSLHPTSIVPQISWPSHLSSHTGTTPSLGPSQGRTVGQEICRSGWGANWGKGGGVDAWTLGMRRPGG